MGDSTSNGSGLVFRTSKLFDNELFSDMEFLVRDQSGVTKIYAHKLILAMASQGFAELFYSSNDPFKTPNQVKISDSTPQVVRLALKYLYTDELNLINITDAMGVFKFASKLKLKDLVEKCRDYIGVDNITEENLFFKYDIALKENMRELLLNCRDFVCANTKTSFASEQFCEASVGVVQDILCQNSLNVENEMDVIKPVLHWCKRDCEKRGRPLEALCIRDSINPFLPHLRFLTLSVQEFCDFVEENEIFTGKESILLTRKILEPDGDCRIPIGFCSNSRQRGTVNFKSDATMATVKNYAHGYSKVVLRSQSYAESPRPPVLEPGPSSNVNSFAQSFQQSEVRHENNEVPLFQFPAAAPKKSMLKIKSVPTVNNSKRHYDFPLEEMQRGMSSVSKRDLICSAEVQVVRGSMVILGVELRVLSISTIPDENVRVHLSISDDHSEKNSISSIKLKNNMIPVMFTEPLKLNYNNSGKIEITIEDLKLNRCNVCKVPRCELNCGLNLLSMINIKSNQANEADGFFFLISRLIYTPN